MKRIFTTIMLLALTLNVFAQAPEKMSYQAVIRGADGKLVKETLIGVKISILRGSGVNEAVAVYEETHPVEEGELKTNSNGLISLEIGLGETSGNFSLIDWSNGPFFIKTETDPAGGTNYTVDGTSQLLSVPYALHAKTATTITTPTADISLKGKDADDKDKNYRLVDVGDPSNPTDAVNRQYVDDMNKLIKDRIFVGDDKGNKKQFKIENDSDVTIKVSDEVTGDGEALVGSLEISSDFKVNNQMLDKENISLSGFGEATADVSLGGYKLIDVKTPSASGHAVNKEYTDNLIQAELYGENGGYIKFPNGIIMQWGVWISPDWWQSWSFSVKFPISFPNKCLNITTSSYIEYMCINGMWDSGDSCGGEEYYYPPYGDDDYTTDSPAWDRYFIINDSYMSQNHVYWQAIGY